MFLSNKIGILNKRCTVCLKKTYGEKVCKKCKAQMFRVIGPICLKCGFPYPSEINECFICSKLKFNRHRSLFLYKGIIRDQIIDLKYHQKIYNSLVIKNLTTIFLKELDYDFKSYDFIIPVPISLMSYWKRGFNQSEIIAKTISRYSFVPIIRNIVKAHFTFKKQKSLTLFERKIRKQRFYLNKKKIKESLINEKNILVVDDVATTFKTLNEISLLLMEGGAGKVDALTLARTTYDK